MAVDCSGQKNKEKEDKKSKEKKKKPTTTVKVPAGSTVTIDGQEPYPEDTSGSTGVSDTAPQEDVPPLQLAPGQQQILPTVPSTAPTPSVPPQRIQIPAGNVFYPFSPWKDHRADSNGCATISYHSGGSGRSCRWQADNEVMKSKTGNNDYRIDVDLELGEMQIKKDQEISITSGGPGSNKGLCCGFTTRININDGTYRWNQRTSR